MECCEDNKPEDVADYILTNMPDGGLIYTYFDADDLLRFLKVMKLKNMLPPKYYITTMNDYRYKQFEQNKDLFEDFIFLGPFPCFDNNLPDSEFKIFLNEMGIKYSDLSINDVMTLNNFYNSILFLKITLSKLSSFDYKQIFSIMYTTTFDVFADGEAYFAKNNFITKNFYVSKYSNGTIVSLISDYLPFQQLRIPTISKVCDCSSEDGTIDVERYNVAIQRYTKPYPSLEYMMFYQSVLLISYYANKVFNNNNGISGTVFEGDVRIEDVIDSLASKNVSHIFVYNYKYEINEKLDSLLRSSNMLMWSMKIHMDRICFSNMYYYYYYY